VGRRGWDGAPPQDDAAARKRILDAAVTCVEQRGAAQTTLSDVAVELGVTRKTVYRYFANTEELFVEVAGLALDSWVTRMRRVTEGTDDPTQLLVESVAYVIEQLPHELLFTTLLESGSAERFSRNMLTATTIARGRMMLCDGRVDWAALGYDDQALDELVEFLLRIIQSMIIAPPERPRSGAELRAYLRRWIGPALMAQASGRALPTPAQIGPTN
jgi:AcrR family transcriptional regulator